MRYLIVNADDFGASHGANRGIVDAHRWGIVTSTSLLVEAQGSAAAAALSRTVPTLSVGLHLALDGVAPRELEAELQRQWDRFEALVGALPTHLDSHHNTHRDPQVLTAVVRLAQPRDLPVREHSVARHCSRFYGQWGGETHPEQISVDGLLRLLDAEAHEGVTELSCHPAYADPDLRSGYLAEREMELRTLCDPAVREALAAREIRLVGFRDLPRVLTAVGV